MNERRSVQAETSPKPWMEGVRPATLWRFWTAAQMVVMTERGVPMHSSSQMMALRMSVGVGRMCARSPQVMAQVATTAQFSQCWERVDGRERDGQTCWLKAAMSPSTELCTAGHGWSLISLFQGGGFAEIEVDFCAVESLEWRGIRQSAGLVRNGMPLPTDHLA